MYTLKDKALAVFAARREYDNYPTRIKNARNRLNMAKILAKKAQNEYNEKQVDKLQFILSELETGMLEAEKAITLTERSFLALALDQYR